MSDDKRFNAVDFPGIDSWWRCRYRSHRWYVHLFGTVRTCTRCLREEYVR